MPLAVPASAQDTGRAEMRADPPPIFTLFGERERLSLTSEQLVALDSIQRQWSAENERLTRCGTVVSGGVVTTVEARRVQPRGREARSNNYRAAQAVGKVLTAEQRQAVCELQGRRRARAWWPWCE